MMIHSNPKNYEGILSRNAKFLEIDINELRKYEK